MQIQIQMPDCSVVKRRFDVKVAGQDASPLALGVGHAAYLFYSWLSRVEQVDFTSSIFQA